MAHEVDMTTGKAAMAYTGQAPWHGLGAELDPSSDLETWVQEAGMNWELRSSPVVYRAEVDPDPEHSRREDDEPKTTLLDLPNRVVLYRSDTLAPISVVSSRYKIVQPEDVAEFFREFTELAGFQMETMGVLRGGAYYWALAKVSKGFLIGKGDQVNPYVLLATSADGSMSTVAHLTSVRVVCMNTLKLSVGPGGERASIQVPHTAEFDPDAVKAELGLIPEWWSDHETTAKKLAKVKISREEAIRYFVDVFAHSPEETIEDDALTEIFSDDWKFSSLPEDEKTPELVHVAKVRPKVLGALQSLDLSPGHDLTSAKGTAWGALNAVTHYRDHVYGREADSRLYRAWMGSGAREKSRAYALARAMVD